MSAITFATSIFPDIAIIHDNETFKVQWKALNAGAAPSGPFRDRLVITSIPEGCPGSDDVEHTVEYDSDVNGDQADFEEPSINALAEGVLMQPVVGPLVVGSHRLTVTLDVDGSGQSSFHCIEVKAALAFFLDGLADLVAWAVLADDGTSIGNFFATQELAGTAAAAHTDATGQSAAATPVFGDSTAPGVTQFPFCVRYNGRPQWTWVVAADSPAAAAETAAALIAKLNEVAAFVPGYAPLFSAVTGQCAL